MQTAIVQLGPFEVVTQSAKAPQMAFEALAQIARASQITFEGLLQTARAPKTIFEGVLQTAPGLQTSFEVVLQSARAPRSIFPRQILSISTGTRSFHGKKTPASPGFYRLHLAGQDHLILGALFSTGDQVASPAGILRRLTMLDTFNFENLPSHTADAVINKSRRAFQLTSNQ